MRGISVRIRHADGDKSVPLCEVEPDRLEWLVNEVKRWGVYIPDGGDIESTSGQFVVEDGEAFFEILCHNKDEQA